MESNQEAKQAVTCSMSPSKAVEVLRARADYIEQHFPSHEACTYGARSQIDAMRMGADAIENSSKAEVSRISRLNTDFYADVIVAVLSGARNCDSEKVFRAASKIRLTYDGTLRWRCGQWLYEQLNGIEREEAESPKS